MKYRLLVIGLAVLLLVGTAAVIWGFQPEMSALPSSAWTNAAKPANATGAASVASAKPASFSRPQVELEGMKGIVSNGMLSLYYEESSSGIAVRNDRTGTIWRSNAPGAADDPIATPAIKNAMNSPVAFTYYNKARQQAIMTSFGDSAAHGQAAAEPIEGGLKVTYQFGKPKTEIDTLPQRISKARLDRITNKAGDSFHRYLSNAYVIRDNPDVYERYDDGLKGTVLRKTLEAFRLAGYNEAELAIDNEEHHVTVASDNSEKYKLSIEYRLDGEQFIVRIPVNEVEYSALTPLTDISVLEFFGAGSPDDEGYMLVPDGSGSLIHMNRAEQSTAPYEQRVYGEDLAVNVRRPYSVTETIRMPVFGLKKNDQALLAIIESGAAAASVKATSSGYLSAFNHVFAEFRLLSRELIRIEAGNTTRELPTYQERPETEDFVIRYVFLEDRAANYSGMAHAYQRYLVDRGMLVKRESAPSDLPFYLELIGAIPLEKKMVGIPYDTMQPLTSFEQAQAIVRELHGKSLTNTKLLYTGWFNGGVNHSLPIKVSPERVLGGTKGLKELAAFGREAGMTLYPDVRFAALYPDSSLTYSPTKTAARHLNRSLAKVYPYDPATGRPDREADSPYLLAPQALPGVVERFMQSYRPFGLQGLSVRDLGDTVHANYRKGQTAGRTQAQAMAAAQMKQMREQMPDTELLVRGGNAYAFPYARHIVDAPMTDSGFHTTDEPVPFYQLVLHGFIDYTGAPYNLNQEDDIREYMLKCLEYGSNVFFAWIYESNSMVKGTAFNHLHAVHYRTWIEDAAAAYKEINSVLKDIAGSKMISHEKLGNDVYKTVFEGGRFVIVNYGSRPATVEGITIEARDYYAGGNRS